MVTATGMWLGVTAIEQGNYAEARTYLTESLKIAYDNGGFGRVTDILFRWGELLRRAGQAEQALEYLTFVQDYPATDERVRDGARLALSELAEQLSPVSTITTQAGKRTLAELVAAVLAEPQPQPAA